MTLKNFKIIVIFFLLCSFLNLSIVNSYAFDNFNLNNNYPANNSFTVNLLQINFSNQGKFNLSQDQEFFLKAITDKNTTNSFQVQSLEYLSSLTLGVALGFLFFQASEFIAKEIFQSKEGNGALSVAFGLIGLIIGNTLGTILAGNYFEQNNSSWGALVGSSLGALIIISIPVIATALFLFTPLLLMLIFGDNKFDFKYVKDFLNTASYVMIIYLIFSAIFPPFLSVAKYNDPLNHL